MIFTTIASVFFLEEGDAVFRLRDAIVRAGMTDIEPLDAIERGALGLREEGREAFGGLWSAFGLTWAIADEAEGLACIQLYSSMNDFLDRRVVAEDEGDDRPALLPFVTAFRDACLALKPLAAFFDPRAHFGDERWENKQGNRAGLLAFASTVAMFDANALADERFSLLYLGEPLAALWNPPVRDDRDEVEVPEGRLLFARSGPSRMA